MADARLDALLETDAGVAPDNVRRTGAYRYDLPPDLIAKTPAEPADAARLMVVGDGAPQHKSFREFPSLLRSGDVLVINETRVIRARLRGTREPGGGAAEILLLRPASGAEFTFAEREWLALVKPGRRLRRGRVRFGDDAIADIVDVRGDGVRVVRFSAEAALEAILERYGSVPLPPYVGSGDAARDARYQTIFARVPGSVAAPTASLHFTPRIMEALCERGVVLAPLVLDVGLGTFKPIEADSIDAHVMHRERFSIPYASVAEINAAKAEGRRVIVAGTTALRAVEAAAASEPRQGVAINARSTNGTLDRETDDAALRGDTDLFIRPGFDFRVADALLTNFHLPASTLLVLVAAFGGYERIMAAYASAITEQYRFYSFGDAMFVYRE